MSSDRRDYEQGEAVLAVFKRGAEFARQLLQENERLRLQIEQIQGRQSSAARHPQEWEKLRVELMGRIDILESERESILERLGAVERENRQFADRYLEIEEENNNLANLYVASYQLHSTLDAGEVLRVILEIAINLIGAEVFCIYVHDERTGALEAVAAEGAPASEFPSVALGVGMVGEAVQSGEVAAGSPGHSASDGPWRERDPVVCIPLRVHDRPVGAIAIYSLLQQKTGFSPLDYELFTLLAGHAATAIFASRLYSASERKLNTIQGFIELLTR